MPEVKIGDCELQVRPGVMLIELQNLGESFYRLRQSLLVLVAQAEVEQSGGIVRLQFERVLEHRF